MKKQPWQRELERKMREQTDRFVEYLGSGEFRNQMVSCGRELLNARLASLPLDPDWRIAGTIIRVESGKEPSVHFDLSVEIDFGDWRATYREHGKCKLSGILMNLPVEFPMEQAREKALSVSRNELRRLAGHIGQTLRGALEERQIPTHAGWDETQIWTAVRDVCVENFQRAFGRHPRYLLGEILEERKQNWAEAALQAARNRVKEAWPGETPFWLRSVEPMACRFQVELAQNRQVCVTCRLSVQYAGETEVTTRAVGDSVFQLTRTVPAEHVRERLGEILEDLARKAREKAVERMAQYEMVAIPPAWSGTPEGRTAWKLLKEGVVRLGQAQVRLVKDIRKTAEIGEEPWKAPPANARLFWKGKDRCLLSPLPFHEPRGFPEIPLGVTDPKNPGSLLAMIRALGVVAERYSIPDTKGIRNPELTFFLSPKGLCGLCCLDTREELKIPGEVFVRDPVQWGTEFFASRLPVLRKKDVEIRRQKVTLDQLNGVQVGMLQYVYSEDLVRTEICRQDLLNLYREEPLFSQAAVERFAKELPRLKICVNGHWERLILTTEEHVNAPPWGRSWADERNRYLYDHFAYDSLHPNPVIDPDRILDLSPRRTSLDDWADLKTSVRQDWLAEEAEEIRKSGDRERCWAFVSALPEKTSKAAAASFLKSDGGQACLRTLAGVDREYALLLLEDLPGCKRLAAELRREAEEAEARAEDGGESSRIAEADAALSDSEDSPDFPASP